MTEISSLIIFLLRFLTVGCEMKCFPRFPPQLSVASDNPDVSLNFHKLLLKRCEKEFQKDQEDDRTLQQKQKELDAAQQVRHVSVCDTVGLSTYIEVLHWNAVLDILVLYWSIWILHFAVKCFNFTPLHLFHNVSYFTDYSCIRAKFVVLKLRVIWLTLRSALTESRAWAGKGGAGWSPIQGTPPFTRKREVHRRTL